MVNETLNTLWHTVYISVDTALIFHFHFCSGCRGVWTTPFEHAHIPLSIFGGLSAFQSYFLFGELFWDGVLSSFQHNQQTTTSLTHLDSMKQTKRTVAWYTLDLRLYPILRFNSFKRFMNLFKHSNNQFEKYQKFKKKVIK